MLNINQFLKLQGGRYDINLYQRYKQVCQLAEQQGEAFAEVVSESFDNLDRPDEFVDNLFYMHSITDDEQFAVFLGMMYEIMDCQMLEKIVFRIVMEQRPSIFFSCFLTSFLTGILNRVGGDSPCPAM